ncbi:MAG: AsmA family protein [Desulfobacterota bacterium]|nr:AsmA family protein [Thermodesulfobacteriota bacterium]
MKKWMKAGIVIFGILVLLVVGLNIFIKSYLSSERLKAMILPRAEALTGRKVSLDEIKVSLFKGVIAKGLSVKEMDGQRDFFKMKEFVLSYRLLPLLKREFVISKIEILSPSVTIIKDRSGKYNFSSILEKRSQTPSKPVEPKGEGLPLSVTADRLFIQNAQLKFVDEEKALPDVSGAFDMEFVGSVEKDGTPKMKSGQISIKEINVVLKGNEIKTTGKIDLDVHALRANLRTLIGKESIDLTLTVKDYLKAPDLSANLYAKELDLDKLMGLAGEEKKSKEAVSKKPPQQKEKPAKGAEGDFEKRLKASGQVKVDSARYQGYTVKHLKVNFRYLNGNLTVEPLGLEFSGGDIYKTEGKLTGKLQLASARPQETLKGDADLKLGKGVIQGSQIFNALSSLTGLKALKEPVVDEGSFHFDLKEEKVFIDGFISSALFWLALKGYLGFDQKLDIPAELKLSPELSKGLSKSLEKWKFMSDEKGWTVIPLKIKGTTDKPDVTLDTEKLARQIVPEITREIEKRLFQKKK